MTCGTPGAGILNKYDIVPVEADDQSNPDVAIREAERLISVEKVSGDSGDLLQRHRHPPCPDL